MQSSHGDSDSGEELNLPNLAPIRYPRGAGRRKISASGLFALCLQVVFFSAAYNFPTPLPAQSRPPSEYELKAAFLFNFAKFIDWPESSFASEQSPFSICILGSDPFGSALDRTLQGKVVGNRPVTLTRITQIAQTRQCQVVFVSSSESRRLPEIVDRLQSASVLLVGESDGFAEAGGAIQFTLEDNRVRFTINTDVADRAGLKFSSKLLALAKIVRDAPNGRKS
jgi:YfiR/HmsC-like